MNKTVVRLDEVFDIRHGNKFDLNKMTMHSDPVSERIAFINRSGTKNGLAAYVNPYNNIEAHPAGLITVALGGAALSSFVQTERFYTAQNIDVLVPLQPMTLDVKLYYCICIEANSFRYSTFGREANRTLHQLLVPARVEVPHWVDGTIHTAAEQLRSSLAELVP